MSLTKQCYWYTPPCVTGLALSNTLDCVDSQAPSTALSCGCPDQHRIETTGMHMIVLLTKTFTDRAFNKMMKRLIALHSGIKGFEVRMYDCPYIRGVQPSQCFRSWSCAQDRCLSSGIKTIFHRNLPQKEIIVVFFDFETNQLPHENVLAVPACSLSLNGTTDVIHSCRCIFFMRVPARRLGASNHTSKVCIKPRCLSQSDWTISPCLAFCSLTTAVSAFCAVLRGENCVLLLQRVKEN